MSWHIDPKTMKGELRVDPTPLKTESMVDDAGKLPDPPLGWAWVNARTMERVPLKVRCFTGQVYSYQAQDSVPLKVNEQKASDLMGLSDPYAGGYRPAVQPFSAADFEQGLEEYRRKFQAAVDEVWYSPAVMPAVPNLDESCCVTHFHQGMRPVASGHSLDYHHAYVPPAHIDLSQCNNRKCQRCGKICTHAEACPCEHRDRQAAIAAHKRAIATAETDKIERQPLTALDKLDRAWKDELDRGNSLKREDPRCQIFMNRAGAFFDACRIVRDHEAEALPAVHWSVWLAMAALVAWGAAMVWLWVR